MKTSLALTIFLAVSSTATAQFSKTGEDTITYGVGNEYNPSLCRNNSYNAYEWLLFERQTEDSSYIVGKKFWRASGLWDSSETVISRTAIKEIQKYPVIASKSKNCLALWQQKTDIFSNIYYSIYSDTSAKWSQPVALTNEALNNTNVHVQSISSDSQFVVAWQSKNAIRITKYPFTAMAVSDTIAISNYDSTEFDLGAFFQSGTIIYTIQATGNTRKIVSRGFNFYPSLSYDVPDTLDLNLSAYQPRFVQAYRSVPQISFHAVNYIFSDIFLYDFKPFIGWPDLLQITNSNNAHVSYCNPHVYYNPIIIANGIDNSRSITPYNHVLVYECRDDSSYSNRGKIDLIIMQYGTQDSITSSGNNCNPTVGSTPITLHGENKLYIPVVWESNRSGKTHLYGKKALLDIVSGVEKDNQSINSFELSQNYPNPFNSSTVIEFSLAKSDFTRLEIIDILGRTLSTLISGISSAGKHQINWVADRHTSGVYFCRLTVGKTTEIKKIVLLR